MQLVLKMAKGLERMGMMEQRAEDFSQKMQLGEGVPARRIPLFHQVLAVGPVDSWMARYGPTTRPCVKKIALLQLAEPDRKKDESSGRPERPDERRAMSDTMQNVPKVA
jgi:hypothetical protein